jgi:hypothetical protein
VVSGYRAGVIDLSPVELAWIDAAPATIRLSTRFAAPPERVFAAFADAASWTRWFPMMHEARWLPGEGGSGGPGGLGAQREVAVRGLGRFRERFIAWEPGRRFAFTVVGTTSPLIRRLGEDYRLAPDGSGTRFDWTMGADPSLPARVLMPALRVMLRAVVGQAAKNLDRQLGR